MVLAEKVVEEKTPLIGTKRLSFPGIYCGYGDHIFELEFDGNNETTILAEMIRHRENPPYSFTWIGQRLIGKRQKRRFKLVLTRNNPNDMEEQTALLKTLGKIPEGQWLSIFLSTYWVDADNVPIAVADPSWKDNAGGLWYPCYSINTGLSLNPASLIWGDARECLWLLEAAE